MNEPVEMSFQLQKDDVEKAFSIVQRESHFWVMVGVAGVIGIIWGGFRIGYNPIVALMTIAIFILIIGASVKQERNKILNESMLWHSPYTVSLSSKGVKTTSIHGNSENTWKGYKKVVETDEYFVLIRRSMRFIVLPKRGFGDKTLEAAREIFRGVMGENFQAKLVFRRQ